MDDANSTNNPVPVFQLIVIPSVITLAVTVVRLIGELQDWSPTLFGKAAGGGASLVGIAWLVPIFGVYFAYRLVGMGHGPANALRVLLSALGGIALFVAVGFGVNALGVPPLVGLVVFSVAAIAVIWIAAAPWPAL